MKRYMLFGMMQFGSSGGMNDFMFDFDTKAEFKSNFRGNMEYYHVFDIKESEKTSDLFPSYIKDWVEENVE